MMAKLQSGGVSQYDIVCLGDYNYQTAIKMNLIQPLDHSKIPNLKNVMPHFRKSYFVYTDNRAVEVLKCGQTHDMVRFDADPDKFIKPPPPGFDIDEYMIRPVNEEIIKLLNHGDIIDLGNRKLEVLHTPGHTNDSIMLLDRKNRPLFTGDTYYPDLLFAFFRDEWGNSDLQVYQKTIKDLTKLAPNLDYLYPCHLEPLAAPHILYDVAKAFEAVNRGEVEYKIEQLYFNPVRVYDFEGFSIGTLDE